MKQREYFFSAVFIFVVLLFSCNKNNFVTSPDAVVYIGSDYANYNNDTLRFDTLFTSVLSPTVSFKIFNGNGQKLHIDNLQLAGGNNSPFMINVNGAPGTQFSGLDIDANDSIYVFVSANIPVTTSKNTFQVLDSIGVQYNGKTMYVKLQAFGQNAYLLNNKTIASDTVFTNDLPILIYGNLTVAAGASLTINSGARLYFHGGAGLQVNGSLVANGGFATGNRITMQADRLDYPYSYLPGMWKGINFGANSSNNVLNYVTIGSAIAGIADTLSAAIPDVMKINLNGCIVGNMSNAGLLLQNSFLNAVNCLIVNSANNVVVTGGGNYNFEYCTIAGYSNSFVTHSPSVQLSNESSGGLSGALNAVFTNTIIYGAFGILNDEITITKTGNTAFSISMNHVLYKLSNDISTINFNASVQNQDPQFVTTNTLQNIYDFHLQAGSPASGAGTPTGTLIDIDGSSRSAAPSIGCYE
ncbi:MAG: hypothetical protein LBE82_10620 [Chitinophagaceae bacterium]|jgi:hypothetical protein|nr:hypothetical protein [Chitinophagaceae bacterium]